MHPGIRRVARRTTALTLLALAACGHEPTGPSREPQVVLLESSQRRLHGSDAVPSFVLYTDGRVIYRTHRARGALWTHVENGDSSYATARLSANERAALLQAAFGDAARDFDALPPTHVASGYSDMPTNTILRWVDGAARGSSVYGWIRPNPESDRASAPEAFLRAFDALSQFRHPRATPWMPRRVTVRAWDGWARAHRDRAVPWPAGWPGLGDPSTRQVGDGEFLIRLSADALPALRKMVSEALVEEGAMIRPFAIDGRRFAVDYLYAFPGEEHWRGAHGGGAPLEARVTR